MIAICDGFSTNVETHENKNAGAGPNASMKYAHSAPDDVFIVPNSAYASAPDQKWNQNKIELFQDRSIVSINAFSCKWQGGRTEPNQSYRDIKINSSLTLTFQNSPVNM